MPARQALRHRMRYFCDGAVLGTAGFVNAVFEREQALRKRFGEKRTTGARRMRGADWGELRPSLAKSEHVCDGFSSGGGWQDESLDELLGCDQ